MLRHSVVGSSWFNIRLLILVKAKPSNVTTACSELYTAGILLVEYKGSGGCVLTNFYSLMHLSR